MKSLKTLGLAAVAAMALTAFLGAGTASATVLCKTNLTSGCAAAGWAYPEGTTIHFTLEPETTLVFQASFLVGTCTEWTGKGATANRGGPESTVEEPISVLSLTNCVNTTDVLSNGSLEIHNIATTSNGTVTSKGAEWTILTSGISCVYGTGAATDIGTLTGGARATLEISATISRISGGIFCPSSVGVVGSVNVTEPEPLYVSAS